MSARKTKQPVAVAGCVRCGKASTTWHHVTIQEPGQENVYRVICNRCHRDLFGGGRLRPDLVKREPQIAHGSATRYEYGTLTEDFLKALPKKPMSLGESLCGDSKAARRIRQLGAAYGPVANDALREAMRIKYQSPNEKLSDSDELTGAPENK